MRTWSFLLACTTLWANGGADAATFRVAAAMDVPVPGTVVRTGSAISFSVPMGRVLGNPGSGNWLTVKRLACDGSFAAGTISRHCRVDLDDLGALDGPWRCDAGVGNCECDVMLGAESVPNHLIFYWSGESGTGPCELIWPLPLIVLPAPQQQAAE